METNSIKIKMHSHYKHFYKHWAKDGEKYIECFNDSYVTEVKNPKNSIALLIEPRPLQPKVYEYIEKNYFNFKYIFTHDSNLLNTLPNAKPIIWGGVWVRADEKKDFSHPISIVASWKEQSPVRIQRKKLAFELKGKIDTYGTFDGGEKAKPIDIYGKYPFSVVIENHIDDLWITEKICNCFACNTIPIYYGARLIGNYFDSDGIIICNSIDEVRTAVDFILKHAEDEYNLRFNSVKLNRKLVENYTNFDDWFFENYRELLKDMGE